MSLVLASPLYLRPSGYLGGIIITVPVKCSGDATIATVNLAIYEGSIYPGAGTLLVEYSKTLSFAKGETKNVEFDHTEVQTGESRRDVGVEVVVGNTVVASNQFDDVYSVGQGGGGFTDILGMIMPIMMLAMIMPMVGGQNMGAGEEV